MKITILKEETVDLKYIQCEFRIYNWEKFIINGKEDNNDNPKTPFSKNKKGKYWYWCPFINVDEGKIVESGTGAGSSLLFFANIVGPEGHVYSYEIREDFVKIIRENIDGTDFDNITLNHQDVTEGFNEEDESIDLVFLDLPSPHEVIKDAYRILKVGSFIAVYTPYVEQFQRVFKELERAGFKDIKIREGNVRELEIKKGRTRPNSRMAGHTGYITFARKI